MPVEDVLERVRDPQVVFTGKEDLLWLFIDG
jgi:hypothetical protein